MTPKSKPDREAGESVPGASGNRRGAGLIKPLTMLRRKPSLSVEELTKHIVLPALPTTDEQVARATHHDTGKKLARQEMWEELSSRIEYADDSRIATPGGELATMLLAAGARHDVVAAAEDAIHDGADPDPEGLQALEEMQAEFYGDYTCALIVALAHIDIGKAWRATADETTAKAHELKFLSHFKRADDLLAPFDAVDLDAPSLAVAQCVLLSGRKQPHKRVADDYEKLIDLDPDSPLHMRALGQDLLPAHYGSYMRLELEARRTAERTLEVWGMGAYAWVYFDALALDRGTLDLMDPGLFIDGMYDIIRHRRDQHVVNLFAAFCAIAMAPRPDKEKLPVAADAKRAQLHDCIDWLIENNLQELHPLIWSQMLLTPGLTPPLPPRRALVAKGRETALNVIADRFAEDIADGDSIAFSSSGMYRLPSH